MSKRRRDARRAARRKQMGLGQQGGMGGMSNKEMQKALANMDTQEIEDVTEVIVRTTTEEIVLSSPEVSIMNMGEEIWSVIPQGVSRRPLSGSGIVEGSDTQEQEEEEDEIEIVLKEDDVKLIMSTTNVSEDEARNALRKSRGDLAAAIMSLS